MLTAEQLFNIRGEFKGCPRLSNCGRGGSVSLLLAERAEIRQELERIRDIQLAGADPMTFGRLTALIERMN